MIDVTCAECGGVFQSYPSNKRRFCGRQCYAKSHVTHGDTHEPLFAVYTQMVFRCHTVSCKHYPSYGSRGIVVCNEWRKSYLAFKAWAHDAGYVAPVAGQRNRLELDRRDNNLGYAPENCRWVSHTIQMRNRRKQPGKTSQYLGVSWSRKASRWKAEIRAEDGRTHWLGHFATEAEAWQVSERARDERDQMA